MDRFALYSSSEARGDRAGRAGRAAGADGQCLASATVRVYAELNDFLPRAWRFSPVCRSFVTGPAVKDFIESVGVPHTEVDLVLVNGQSVAFTHRVQNGDRISAFPVFESIDIASVTRVRSRPLRDLRFVLDVHLGRLAAYLRLAGFDTRYETTLDDPELAAIAAAGRVLLTRDRELLKRRAVTRGYWLRSTHPRTQLADVLRRFDLSGRVRPFSRCLRCNATVVPVRKEDVLEQLLPRTRQHVQEFWRCSGCGRVYWRGGHVHRLQRVLDEAIRTATLAHA